ncbi:CLUMA_CG014473, isoform A [Clunio marinus]|uniref:CLUMA_CG014473, isoform A n=1 Tax=Clunio marinus TaxID=568069 RepID=A0A1J1IMW8_9DIPT|nr:CLUMA_CG014473, isoform A [Clunio marinus]
MKKKGALKFEQKLAALHYFHITLLTSITRSILVSQHLVDLTKTFQNYFQSNEYSNEKGRKFLYKSFSQFLGDFACSIFLKIEHKDYKNEKTMKKGDAWSNKGIKYT